MIAMQYSFTLPADYDMEIIRRRIAEKGHLLDDFPGLVFKAYMYADRKDAQLPARENLYAPFYLWRDSESMNAFLGGAGFAAVAQAFGWPSVRIWSVWQTDVAANLATAQGASCEWAGIPAHTAMDTLRRTESEAVRADVAAGALATVSAFDPTGWMRLRFRLWPHLPAEPASDERRLYRIGHISQPGTPR